MVTQNIYPHTFIFHPVGHILDRLEVDIKNIDNDLDNLKDSCPSITDRLKYLRGALCDIYDYFNMIPSSSFNSKK